MIASREGWTLWKTQVSVFTPARDCGCVFPSAATPAARAEGRDGAKQKRRCYQRRSGALTRGTGPLRLALAGATRSGSAGVGSRGSRSAGEATPHPSGVNWNGN
jgi:hypothetical protein